MKILLLSDTHGDLSRPCEIYKKLTDIDLILHCGDYKSDGIWLGDQFQVPVTAVSGNCDASDSSETEIVETPAGKILLTHGHGQLIHWRLDNLLYLAEEKGCIAACFGHTHKAMCENTDGIWLINPGSLSEPRDYSKGTYAILNCTEEGFSAEIIEYEPPAQETEPPNDSSCSSSNKKKQVKGGFLRGLLNYSDRF